ncbi:hypothetical protein [Wolbachia endosymbiont of Pentidionis agamae]
MKIKDSKQQIKINKEELTKLVELFGEEEEIRKNLGSEISKIKE